MPAEPGEQPAPAGSVTPRRHHRRRGGAVGEPATTSAAQTITGQHIHVTEQGIRLRPWHLRYADPAELDAMAEAAGLALAWRHADWDGDALRTRRRRPRVRATAAVTSEACSPPAPHESAPAQPAHGALGHRRRRAGIATRRAHLPSAAGGVRPVAPVPLLPRQRGGHPTRPRDLRPGRHLARARRPEPVPRLRGQRAPARAEPRAGVHAGVGQRRARGARVQPGAHRTAGPTSTTSTRGSRWRPSATGWRTTPGARRFATRRRS